jgi:hypothetical protein
MEKINEQVGNDDNQVDNDDDDFKDDSIITTNFMNNIKPLSQNTLNFGIQLGLITSSFITEGISQSETKFKDNIHDIIDNTGLKLPECSDLILSIPQYFVKTASYINNFSANLFYKEVTDFEIPIIKLHKINLCLPILSKNSNVFYEDSCVKIDEQGLPVISENILANALTILSVTEIKNRIIFYSDGTNSFTDKPNTCILFTYGNSRLNSNTVNFFTCMYYSFLLYNLDYTEENVLDIFAKKIGFSINGYDYFRNDFYYHYSMYNTPLFYTDNVNSINYPLHCSRISGQIYFLWSLVYYYAKQNTELIIDEYFSMQFFKCMYENMNGSDIITVSQINNTFADLLPLNLDSTIQYWVTKINESINITNLFLLQHAFELLDYDIELLIKNDVEVLKEKNIEFDYYTKRLNDIFANVEKAYKVNTLMVSQYYSEEPLGVANINKELGLAPLYIRKSTFKKD